MSALLIAFLFGIAASGQEPVAAAVLERPVAEVGQSVSLRIRVRARLLADVEIDDAPLLAMRGEELEVEVLSPGAMEQSAVGTGLRFEYHQDYSLRARIPGEWSIPALEVRIEELGQTLRTEPVEFAARRTPGREGTSLELHLRGPQEPVFVGQWFWLDLEVETGAEAVVGAARLDPGLLDSSELFDVRAEPLPEGAVPWTVRWLGRRMSQLQLVQEEAAAPRRRWRARLALRAREGVLAAGPVLSVAAGLEVRPDDSAPGVRGAAAPATCELRVQPLPEQGRPESFRGAVGQFQLEASLFDERRQPQDSFEVRVAVTGTPPPDAAALPDLTGIARFLHHGRRDQLEGDRRRAIFAMADRLGEAQEVPAIEWSFFDPERGGYQSCRAGPFPLRRVTGAGRTPGGQPAVPDRDGWLRPTLVAVAVAALLLVGWAMRRKQGPARERHPPPVAVPSADLGPLGAAESPAALQRAWHGVLAAALGSASEELAAADLSKRLEGRAPSLRRAVLEVDRGLEEAVYGGADTDLSNLRELAREAGRALLADPGDPEAVPGPDPAARRK